MYGCFSIIFHLLHNLIEIEVCYNVIMLRIVVSPESKKCVICFFVFFVHLER